MFSLFEARPDHPLFDLEETRRLIAELPAGDFFKALEDITFWLDTIKAAKGFHPEVRAAIILLLDETALPMHTELLHQYLSAPHLQDFKGVHQWKYLHAYAKALAEAYTASADEYQAVKNKPLELKQQLPLFCVRWARALAAQMKLELLRYLGAVRALSAVEKIEKQNEEDPLWQERRFGSEFTPAGKLTVLKHLMTWWSPQPPLRHQDHRGISATVDVIHGFKLISQLVTRIELGSIKDETERERRISLAAEEDMDYTSEVWTVTDISVDEIGIKLARSAGAWVKVGDLCGIRTRNNPLWWVGTIRRVHTDAENTVHLVIAIIAKKPLSIWLRALGKGAEKASNWETSSGSFKYTYLPAIILPDVHNSYLKATMLMESGAFVPDNFYQALMGERSREIKLVKLLGEGEDYEEVGFEWLA